MLWLYGDLQLLFLVVLNQFLDQLDVVVSPLLRDRLHLNSKFLMLLDDVVEVFLAQDQELHLTLGCGRAVSPFALVLKEDVVVAKVRTLHVGDERDVCGLCLPRAHFHEDLDLATHYEVD